MNRFTSIFTTIYCTALLTLAPIEAHADQGELFTAPITAQVGNSSRISVINLSKAPLQVEMIFSDSFESRNISALAQMSKEIAPGEIASFEHTFTANAVFFVNLRYRSQGKLRFRSSVQGFNPEGESDYWIELIPPGAKIVGPAWKD